MFTALTAILALALAQPAPSRFEGTKPGEERTIGSIRFCWAPSGRFRMGSPASEPRHRSDEGPVDVTISDGFWTGKFEVTQSQWAALMGAFPREQDKGRGNDYPVHWINYPEAEEFCRRLTAQSHADGSLPKDWEIRLPTEAQWEYACRAGTTTATSFGNRLDATHANIATTYPEDAALAEQRQSTKAGSYPPNAWGIHDMHGNVWEWCRDWYHSQLPGGVDPDFIAVKGDRNRDGTYSRVRRGGAWIEQGWACRSAMRLRYEPERRSDHIGFRVVAVKP